MKPIEYIYLKNPKSINWQKLMPVGGIGLSVLLIGIFLLSFINTLGNNSEKNIEIEDGFIEKERSIWWDSEYKFYRRLSIQNFEDFETLDQNVWVEFQIAHDEMVKSKKSLEDGSDLIVIYKNEEDVFREVNAVVTNTNSENTTVSFQLQQAIESYQKDFEYFLYYGSKFPVERSVIDYVPEIASSNYKIHTSTEVMAPLFIQTNRKWILKNTKEFAEYSKLEVNVSIHEKDLEKDAKPQVKIGDKIFDLSKSTEGSYTYSLDANTLEAGEHKVRAILQNKDKTISSATEITIVSNPLYVAWTMDWEGYDTSDKTIEMIDNFSTKYGVPITHFWNPRINFTGMSTARRDQLLKWLKDRMNNFGDSVGLHLHMHFDLVKVSGVEKILDRPHWGGRANGSDVPTSEYPVEDFVKMVEWSFVQFEKMGLPKPTMYRAGGWYADLEMLEALSKLGFVLDSSGRTKYSLGRDIMPADPTPTDSPEIGEEGFEENQSEYIESELDTPISAPISTDEDLIPWQVEYEVEGHWDLKSTTKPYKVSKFDQNSSKEPTLDIWEFPNNGADSWRFNGEELLTRFRENFGGEYLKEPQVLNYLSHPHAINVDIPKLEKAYDEINKFRIIDDNGPIIHTTLDRCYEDYNEFSN